MQANSILPWEVQSVTLLQFWSCLLQAAIEASLYQFLSYTRYKACNLRSTLSIREKRNSSHGTIQHSHTYDITKNPLTSIYYSTSRSLWRKQILDASRGAKPLQTISSS